MLGPAVISWTQHASCNTHLRCARMRRDGTACGSISSHSALAVRRVPPVEGKWRLAEGEAVDVAGDGAFQRVELAGGARLQPAVEAVVMRLQGERGVARPVGAPRIA